jgi:hypothetical protein
LLGLERGKALGPDLVGDGSRQGFEAAGGQFAVAQVAQAVFACPGDELKEVAGVAHGP